MSKEATYNHSLSGKDLLAGTVPTIDTELLNKAGIHILGKCAEF